jgi:methyltransferase (TIGR00027 family)
VREGKPSRTAQQNALFRALEARRPDSERVANDHLAVGLLPPSFRVLAEVARVSAFRRAIESIIDRRWPGPRGGQVVRTAHIDGLVEREAPDAEQIVFLGAGLDTRPYRLALDSVTVFEVDHPATQHAKRSRIGRDASHVTFVPVDFSRDDTEASLLEAGFRLGVRTVVVWEGVTNYLTAQAVDDVITSLRGLLGAGSILIFTYIERGAVDGSSNFMGAAESARAVTKVGEPYTFGFDPGELRSYLLERGFDLLSDDPVADLARRYYRNGQRPPVYAYYHVVEARKR